MSSRSRGVRTEKGESPPSCTFPTFVSLLLSWRHSVMGTDTRQLSFLTDFQIVDQTGCAQLGGSQHDQGLTHLYFVRLRAKYRWVSPRSEEHTSELQSLMRISYAVFCLRQKNKIKT